MFFSQEAATPPAQNILTSENSPWEPTSPEAPFPSCSQCCSCSCHHTAEANHGFIPHSGFHPLSQALCCKPTLTKPLFRDKESLNNENPPAGGSFPRGSFPRAGQPGALPLWSVSLSSHTTPCMTGYRPGWEQSFSWGHFSSSAVVLSWYCISRMLWEAPVPTQPCQTRQTDRLKASVPFWESFHHTDSHEQFWYRGKYP